jgi:predicted ribosome quality control (RQC) complex YloA/Tae2 family protein
MLTNYYTIGYIATTLDAILRRLQIEEVFTQTADEMVLRFGARGPSLVFSCKADLNVAYIHEHFARARTNSTDVLPDAHNRTVTAVLRHPIDRVITLVLSSGHRIVLQFFGPQANALLLGPDSVIRDAFRKSKQLIGQPCKDHTGEMVYDLDQLPLIFRTPGPASIDQALRKLYPALGPTLTKELLHRSGIAFNADPSTLSSDHVNGLRTQFRNLLIELGTPRPRVYLDINGAPSVFSIVHLTHLHDTAVREFDDIHAAIRLFVSHKYAGRALDERIAPIRASLRREQQKLHRALHAMTREQQVTGRADEYEHAGQTLMAHLNEIRKGDPAFAADGVSIPLQLALTPVQNAQHYFKKAKRSRAAAEETSIRIVAARERLSIVTQLLEGLDSVISRDDLTRFTHKNIVALETLQLVPKAAEREQLPFRTFIVDGGFKVWAGKSSQKNDILTMKYSKPNDLWFHARGSSGSHVILKADSARGEPGKRAKEQAAAIAAYYSKMRGSSLVPVAMTERKYVRKPKGAPPGTVLLERETVLLVEPALPKDTP